MKKFWAVAGLTLTIVAGLLTGLHYNHVGRRGGAERRILHYRDPMHPAYTSDRPGKAPDCGMDLEPVYVEEDKAAHSEEPGIVQVSAEHQQLIGVQLGTVEISSTTHTLRTLGRVALDETRVFPLITGSDGWVTQILSGGTGSAVTKGQALVVIYGREYTTAQRAFLYTLRSLENSPPIVPGDFQDRPALSLDEARLNLKNMGVSDAQIQQITNSRQVMLAVTLTAAASGIVVSRNVFSGQRFERGTELFRIADMSHVWVMADLFGEEARYIRSGATAQVSLPGSETMLRATVSTVFSTFDTSSRSLKVRLETANPDVLLRPGMFVELKFPIKLAPSINVPADAVRDSGIEKTVFVDRGHGRFESRLVETGWRFGNRVQIVRGLKAGETIVVSGIFLLDSEARMRGAQAGPHD